MKSKITPNKPVLLVLYGFPGSGKSSFARQFAELVNSVHIQTDKITSELFDGAEGPEQDRVLKYLARQFMQSGLSVLYDGNTASYAERRTLSELAKTDKLTSLIVWLQIDPDTAFFRTQNRDKRKTDAKFAKVYTEDSFGDALAYQQNPLQSEHYVVISGKHTFNTQFSAVIKKLSELGAINPHESNQTLVKPELVNNIPNRFTGRADMTQRNISIR